MQSNQLSLSNRAEATEPKLVQENIVYVLDASSRVSEQGGQPGPAEQPAFWKKKRAELFFLSGANFMERFLPSVLSDGYIVPNIRSRLELTDGKER